MKNSKFLKLWGMPLLLGAVLLAGLILALATDGLGDVVAWILLLIPLYITIRKYFFSRQ